MIRKLRFFSRTHNRRYSGNSTTPWHIYFRRRIDTANVVVALLSLLDSLESVPL